MEPEIYKEKYCFEYTYGYTWYEVDNYIRYSNAWSEEVYAATAGKARYKAFMSLDLMREEFLEIKVRRKRSNDLVLNPCRHPIIEKLTKAQLDKMFHTIGGNNQEIHRLSFYRNHYVSGTGTDFECL